MEVVWAVSRVKWQKLANASNRPSVGPRTRESTAEGTAGAAPSSSTCPTFASENGVRLGSFRARIAKSHDQTQGNDQSAKAWARTVAVP